MLFVLKSVVLPLLVAIIFILHLLQLASGMAQFYFTGVHLECLEGRGLKFIYIYKIGVNLYQEFTFVGQ